MDYSSLPNLGDSGVNVMANSTSPAAPQNGASSGATMIGVSSGIQAIGNIASAISNVNAFKAQVEADTKAKISNMNNIMDSFEYRSYKLEEAYNSLDSQFSDKVSERLLQSMKDVATARLMSAESGGTTGDIESGLSADEMFDVAVINSQRRRALGDIYSDRETSRMNAVNQVKSIASGGVNVRANSLVSAMSGATNSLGSLLATMPNDVRVEFFGMNTSGTQTDFMSSKPK